MVFCREYHVLITRQRLHQIVSQQKELVYLEKFRTRKGT